MFKINKETVLTEELLSNMFNKYKSYYQTQLKKYKDYYDGKQNIIYKSYSDSSKPINKIVNNYCDQIVSNYLGYLAGLPITYKSNDDITNLQQVLTDNDVNSKDSALLRDALIYGVGYELVYITEQAAERFATINPIEGFPIYSNDIEPELLYFVRYYLKDEFQQVPDYIVEIYSSRDISTYSTGNFTSFTLLDSQAHVFGKVPVSVFNLNEENTSIFDKIISLQDAYNNTISDCVDDIDAFADSYLTLSGADMTSDDISTMKEDRVLILPEGSIAEYLTKNINDSYTQNLLINLNDNIHKFSNSPDFNDEKLLAQSGIAMRFKLLGFNNRAAAIEQQFRRALNNRLQLINTIEGIKAEQQANVDIVFNYNLPVDIAEKINLVNTLYNRVSDRTLLAQLPFINNVDEELAAVQEQKSANAELYSFGTADTGDDVDE